MSGAKDEVEELEPFPEQTPEEAMTTAVAAGAVREVVVGDEVITIDHLEESAGFPVQVKADRLVGQPFVVEAAWAQPKMEGKIKLFDMIIVSGRLAEMSDEGTITRRGGRPVIFIAGRINQIDPEENDSVLASEFEPLLVGANPATGEAYFPLGLPRGLTAHAGQQGGSYYTMRRPAEENADVDLWGDGE